MGTWQLRCSFQLLLQCAVMLMPLISCHKTDDFSLLIVPVSFVKLPDSEARTSKAYLINPTRAMLVFSCVITKEMAGAAGRSLSAFVHHALSSTFFHFFAARITAQTFPAGKNSRHTQKRSVSWKFESHQHNNIKSTCAYKNWVTL